MDLKAFRESRGLSQQATATQLGLKSKSYLSMLETGAAAATFAVALRIEAWSEGQVPAVGLLRSADADLLTAIIKRAAAVPAR